jgi:hypothetical protein
MQKVTALIYDEYWRFGFDDEDDAANALFKHGGNIERLIDRFVDRGRPFDVYLAKSLRYLARTVRRERRQKLDRELVCERTAHFESGESEAKADPPFANPGEKEIDCAAGTFAHTVHRRRPRARGGLVRCGSSEKAAYSSRLIFLALKCAWEIDEEGITHVAAAAKVDREWLASSIEQARRSLVSERARIESLAERRNASWCRRQLLEARSANEADPYRRERLVSAIRRERRRHERVQREFSTLRTLVPNSVVARILGVPKGTVDSGIYYLRKQYGSSE